MQLGYLRISKADGSQVLDLQRDALLAAGVEADQLYQDLASGKRDDRPGLAACLKALRQDDVLVAWKLDRLGRDLRHLVNLVHELTSRGVGLRILTGQGASIDTSTAAGNLVFGIFAALAEFERELIIERTKAGLLAARAWPAGWSALQDDTRQAPPRPCGHGRPGDQGRRPLPGTRRHPADSVPARRANRRVALRRTEAAEPGEAISSAYPLKSSLTTCCSQL